MRVSGLRLQGVKEDKVLTGPESVDIHITSTCNLNCSYCWFHSPLLDKEYEIGHIDFGLFTRIVDDLHAMGVESLTFSGEGEPTLHPRIKDMIGYVKERGFRLKILTNGTFGNGLMQSILRADSITINLATLSPEKYRKIQSRTGYDMIRKAIDNIIKISKIKKRAGLEKPKVKIGFVINEENHSEIESIFSFAEKYGMGLQFRLMKARKENEQLILSEGSAKRVREQLERIIKKDNGRTNALDIHRTMSRPSFLKKRSYHYPEHKCHRIFYYDAAGDRKIKCFMGWYFSHINTEGNVFLCCQNPFLVAGNLKRDSFRSIWNSGKYMRLRLRCKSGIDVSDTEGMECMHCPFIKDNEDIGGKVS